jgi:hypothetical protein
MYNFWRKDINFLICKLQINLLFCIAMTQAELIKQLTDTLGKTKVNKLTQLLKKQEFALHDLIDLTFHANKRIAFRAAWLLENLLLINPMLYLPEIDYLISKFKDVEYQSCQRHYAKIIMHLTSLTAHHLIKEKLQAINMEPVINKCFDWMIDPKVLIAVKVFSAKVYSIFASVTHG